MLPLKWLLFVAALLLLLLFVLVKHLVLEARRSYAYAQVKEAPEQYRREMHYLESLVFHVAFKEGSVSRARVCELVPGIADCPSCCRHLQLAFFFGAMRGDLIARQAPDSYGISPHVNQLVVSAETFQDLGQAWVLPASKIVFEHQACHAEHSS